MTQAEAYLGGGAIAMAPLWQKKIFFGIEKKLENLVGWRPPPLYEP